MPFRELRVSNKDRRFFTHPHRDLEIITYVLEGAPGQKDSMDNGAVIRPGEAQRPETVP